MIQASIGPPLHLRQHQIAHLAEHLLVGPLALSQEVQQRLVLGAGPARGRRRRDRLRALALAVQQQPRAIGAHRGDPRRVLHHARNFLQIRRKTLRTVVRSPPVHRSLPRCESDASLIRSRRHGWQSDSVRLSRRSPTRWSTAMRATHVALLQGPSLRFGLCCPKPSTLNRPHPPHSRAHSNFAALRFICCAFAVRERLGDPRVDPGFR